MKNRTITVKGSEVTIATRFGQDYISLTDMLKAKDGDFFISDWLRNRNTVEFLGIWESVYNPDFNYGEFAIIKSQAGLNSYKISVKQSVRLTQLNSIAISQMQSLLSNGQVKRLANSDKKIGKASKNV